MQGERFSIFFIIIYIAPVVGLLVLDNNDFNLYVHTLYTLQNNAVSEIQKRNDLLQTIRKYINSLVMQKRMLIFPFLNFDK